MQPSIRPMSVGEMLDRTFQIYRQYFSSAFLMLLATLGPLYLIYNYVIFDISGLNVLFNGGGVDAFDDWITNSEFEQTPSVVSILLLFLGMPIAVVLLGPVSVAGQLHIVRAAILGERPVFGELWKRAFRPYWKMVGNSLLFALAMMAVYFVLVIALMIVFAFVGFISAMLGSGLMMVSEGSSYLGFGIIIGILFGVGYLISLSVILGSYAYFGIRFGFFLPLITLTASPQTVTLAESWKLTKGTFKRIFGMLVVISLLNWILSLIVMPLLLFSIVNPLLGQLLYGIGLIAISPISVIAYGVVYHDLLVRVFGVDLRQRISQMSRLESDPIKDAPLTVSPLNEASMGFGYTGSNNGNGSGNNQGPL